MAHKSQAAKPKSSTYPEPLVIPPLREHRQTIIILHGRGSTAAALGPEILATSIPELGSLPFAFPNAKFVFPTASVRRATIFKRSPIHQWFDNWSLVTPTEREELQIEGLKGTNEFIHQLLRQEIEVVGAGNVVLGGLSQGCAALMTAMLLWDGDPPAGVFGMCGWLPFRKHLEDIAAGSEENIAEEDDPFARPESPHLPPVQQALDFLRTELELQTLNTLVFQKIPFFLGHGIEDAKVRVGLGREAASCLKTLNANMMLKEYEGLGRWYSGQMLAGIIAFVQKHAEWDEPGLERKTGYENGLSPDA